jgi:hypothetical protein
MKCLFASSFLLLTLASNLAGATGPSGKESLIFTSNPHPPCVNECKNKDDKPIRFEDITEQYKWINSYKPDGKSVAGVVVNGNLTGSGSTDDLMKISHLLGTLKVPYLIGLGGNDYILNKESCPVCAVRSVWYFNKHIVNKMMLNKKGVFANLGNVYYDFEQSITGHTDALKQTHGAGRLGYTVDLGENKNIYLIQLNGHVGANVKANKFVLEGKDRDFDVSYNYYYINPVVDWLEDRLEYAAQYQLNHSGALPKTVVVTMNGDTVPAINGDTVDPAIVAVLNKYKIGMRFLGNDGSSNNCKNKNDMADDSKFYCLGYSTERELLELVLDYDKSDFNVIKRTVNPDSKKTIRTAADFYPLQPHYPIGTYPAQNKIVLFGHYGEYDGQASLRDSVTNQVLPGTASAMMTLNTGRVYGLSKDTGKFNVSFMFDPGGRFSEEVLDSSRLNLTAPVVCVETSGLAGESSRNSHEKVLQSTEDKSLNRCFDEWSGYYN